MIVAWVEKKAEKYFKNLFKLRVIRFSTCIMLAFPVDETVAPRKSFVRYRPRGFRGASDVNVQSEKSRNSTKIFPSVSTHYLAIYFNKRGDG